MWKDANVIPLYKCGDKSADKNYRSISLTSVVFVLVAFGFYINEEKVISYQPELGK